MSRNTQLVLLCEDKQQAAFLRRFLEKQGWDKRRMRVQIGPPGEGSAEQFVRERFPQELAAYRSKVGQVGQALVVMIDGDQHGVESCRKALSKACEAAGISSRDDSDRVAIFVPTRRIETWFAYLDGQVVDEAVRDYPRLPRERDCQRHADALDRMCRAGKLTSPPPPSLAAACDEYRQRLRNEHLA